VERFRPPTAQLNFPSVMRIPSYSLVTNSEASYLL
jgi:hypothetical protein